MFASKLARRYPVRTAVGQNAEPATPAVAGVRIRFGLARLAAPFVFHPPAVGAGTLVVDPMTTFDTAWRSVREPVEPPKPTSTDGGTTTAFASTGVPLIDTVRSPFTSVATTCTVAPRNAGTAVAVASHASVPLLVPLPVLMPTKFADGSGAFFWVSSATAIPGTPPNPSRPPVPPSEVAVAPFVGSANTSV